MVCHFKGQCEENGKKMIRMVVLSRTRSIAICSSLKRGPNPKLDTDILNVVPIKQENSSKGFSSFRTVEDTAEGFTKPVLQEYVFIFCKLQTEP